MDTFNLMEIRASYDLWWEGKNEEPIFCLAYPIKGGDFSSTVKDWMSPQNTKEWCFWKQELIFGQALELTIKTGDFKYIEEALDLLEKYFEVTGYAGEGYPFLLPGFGPGVLSAFITNYSKFKSPSIWFEMEKPMEWEDLMKVDENTRAPFADTAMEALKRLSARLKGKCVIAIPDLCGPLDILSSIRGVNNLLMDTMDYEEEMPEVINTIEKLWRKHFNEMSEIIDPNNCGSYTNVFRYLSSKPLHTSICDFSAMISPRMFEEFALPTLKNDSKQFKGRLVYHLDGTGQLPHIDMLCSIQGLHAIQWVPGAGNEDSLSEKHYPLYKKIIESGKKICLSDDFNDGDRVKRLFKAFPKKEFLIHAIVKDEKQARELMKLK